jgi:hypothetical protein
MVLIVRDEGDILERNLRYHHALGVDRFIVTDNGSVDETPEILGRYEEAGLVQVIDEAGGDFAEKERDWLTRMGRMAASEHNAAWVIYGDADEFWLPSQGSLRDALASVPEPYGVVIAPRTEFVGRADGTGDFAERLTVREARSRVQPKVAHRGEADVVAVDRGGHVVAVAGASGDVADTLRPPGRPVHRMVRNPDENQESRAPGDETRLVWAPMWPLRILHFPVRSFEQFKRRAEIAVAGSYPDRGVFARLRREHAAGRLEDLYAGLVLSDEEIEEGIRDGRLVRDERFHELLAGCPDPLSGAQPGTVKAQLEPARLEREQAELEFDAMQLLGRTEGWLVLQRNRNRDRIEELLDEKDKLTATRNRMRRQRDRRRRANRRLRQRLEHKGKRIEELRRKLRVQRQRPWSRLRRATFRAIARVTGRGRSKRS